MAKPRLFDKEKVDAHIANLDPTFKDTLCHIREMVLAIGSEIAEQIKWNSMSFYYTGEMEAFDAKEYKRDLLVCNVHRGKILLVFPSGSKIVDHIQGKNYPDGRKIITIEDFDEFETKKASIKQIINDWLATAV